MQLAVIHKDREWRPNSCLAYFLLWNYCSRLCWVVHFSWSVQEIPWGNSFLKALSASTLQSFKVLHVATLDIFLSRFDWQMLIKRASDLGMFSVLIRNAYRALHTSRVCHMTSVGCLDCGQMKGRLVSWNLWKMDTALGRKVGSVLDSLCLCRKYTNPL